MKYKSGGEDLLESLANGIIIQAAKDYRSACVRVRNPRSRKKDEAERMKEECLRFFRSQWFTQLTRMEPEFLIRRLDEKVTA